MLPWSPLHSVGAPRCWRPTALALGLGPCPSSPCLPCLASTCLYLPGQFSSHCSAPAGSRPIASPLRAPSPLHVIPWTPMRPHTALSRHRFTCTAARSMRLPTIPPPAGALHPSPSATRLPPAPTAMAPFWAAPSAHRFPSITLRSGASRLTAPDPGFTTTRADACYDCSAPFRRHPRRWPCTSLLT
ncbi:MAG: hypothetical protein J3K34DRAFT_399751 [Monoraphidium minutum]|nr:MAG: hypothetical protein J3K34DRAFT_399751 [Monoraphidium minutum]